MFSKKGKIVIIELNKCADMFIIWLLLFTVAMLFAPKWLAWMIGTFFAIVILGHLQKHST